MSKALSRDYDRRAVRRYGKKVAVNAVREAHDEPLKPVRIGTGSNYNARNLFKKGA